MAMPNVENRRRRGRPRAFDRETVLERAMEVFWAGGFEGASIPKLSEAMGISPQSLYAAFVSKEALYEEALRHYGATVGGFVARSLEGHADVIDAMDSLLVSAAETFTRTSGAPGCMISATITVGDHAQLEQLGRDMRAASVDAIDQRLRVGIADGQIGSRLEVREWARLLSSVVQGMSVQARDGATREELMGIARIATRALREQRTISTN